jgi:hypothetical protein
MAKRYPKDLRARAVALCRRRRKLTETGAGPRSRRLDRNPLCDLGPGLRRTPRHHAQKTLHAAEQDRPDVAAARAELKVEQSRLDAPRLVFIDETAAACDQPSCRPASWHRPSFDCQRFDVQPATPWECCTDCRCSRERADRQDRSIRRFCRKPIFQGRYGSRRQDSEH